MRPPSLIRYPGGKSKLAELIAKRLAPHIGNDTVYVEPFLGGGSVGLAVMEAFEGTLKQAMINDFNPAVAALWTSVIKHHEELKALVMAFRPSVGAFYEFKQSLLASNVLPSNDSGILELGFRKLAIHRISYSGLGEMSGSPLGGKSQRSSYTIDSRWNPIGLCKAIDKAHQILISAGVETCRCLSFKDVLNGLSEDSLVYLDPPYVEQGKVCYKLSFGDADHIELANILRSASCNWLLSYDNCSLVRSLYAWTGIEELPVKNTMRHATLENGAVVAKAQNELLLGPALRRLPVMSSKVA